MNFFKLSKRGSVLFAGLLLFAACSKDKDQDNVPTPTAQVALIVASPGAPELSFYLGGKKSTTSKPLTYGTTIPYGSVAAGKYDLGFNKKDSTKVLAKINSEIKKDKNYTLMIGDKSPKAALVLVEDDLSAPATNKAKIRFANLCSDSLSLDLYVGGKTETAISKKSFKNVSGFVNIDPGAELKLEVKENGKTEVLAVVDKFKIEKGKIYTIWTKGIKSATDATKLGIEVMINK